MHVCVTVSQSSKVACRDTLLCNPVCADVNNAQTGATRSALASMQHAGGTTDLFGVIDGDISPAVNIDKGHIRVVPTYSAVHLARRKSKHHQQHPRY